MTPHSRAGPPSASGARRPGRGLLCVIAGLGYASGVGGSVAPLLAADFGLDDAGIARLYAWIGVASLGSLPLGLAADRFGRRRTLLAGATLLPLAALASALAPSLGAYVCAQLVVCATSSALLATANIAIAEQLSAARRARGHGIAGSVFTCATAAPLLLAAAIAAVPNDWRIVWATAALPLLALPFVARDLVETTPWHAAVARGEVGRARIASLFAATHRARTLAIGAAIVCVSAVESATRTWLLYHQVRGLGLDPAIATAVLVCGGGLGLAGFGLGGRLADRFGRRAAFAGASSAFALAVFGYYALAANAGAWRLPVLFASVIGISGAGGAALVAFRAAATELFPTALRGALGGVLAVGSAVGWWIAMQTVSELSGTLGGIGPAIAALTACALPIAALCLWSVPETAGADLEATPAFSAPR